MQNPGDMFFALPNITPAEAGFLQQIVAPLQPQQRQQFLQMYAGMRVNPQDVLMYCLVGLFLVPGLQRFILKQIGMGILYLLTLGLCFVGSIIDLVNHKRLADERNRNVAAEVMAILNAGSAINPGAITNNPA